MPSQASAQTTKAGSMRESALSVVPILAGNTVYKTKKMAVDHAAKPDRPNRGDRPKNSNAAADQSITTRISTLTSYPWNTENSISSLRSGEGQDNPRPSPAA